MMSNKRGRPSHKDILTPAEWRVAEQLRHGLGNRRIAERTGISTEAVKFHVANLLGKLGFTSRKQVQSWRGVAATSRLAAVREKARQPEESSMELGQIARTVSDIAEARAWYGGVLDLPELYNFGTLAFFDLGGVRLMLSEKEGGLTSESILYLRVPDLHGASEQLESKGVTFTHAPHLIHRHPNGTEEWMAFFEDNEGRPLALMSQIGPARD